MLSRTAAVALMGLSFVSALAQQDYIPSGPLYEMGLTKSWQLQLELACDQCVTDLFLVDDQLYLPTQDGWVYAVDAVTGANRWLRQITTGAYRVRRPAYAGDRVIFATPTTVTQVNKITGEGIAQMTLRFPAGTGPATDGTRMFLGGLDRRLHAFEIDNPVRTWRVILNAAVTSTPAVYGRDVYFASDDGSIYAAATYNKVLHWAARTYGPIGADLMVNDYGVYVPCLDNSLYMFDLRFGELQWRVRFSGPLHEAPVLAGDTAYQYTQEDGLVAVDAIGIGIDERIKWKLPDGRMLLTTDGPVAFVLSREDTIVAIDVGTGEVLLEIPAFGLCLGAPQPGWGSVFLASPDGRIFCARPVGAPLIRRESVREALAQPLPAGTPAPATVAPAAPPPGARVGIPVAPPGEPPIGGRSKVSKGYGGGKP